MNAPNVSVCFLCRNSSVSYEWFDDFVHMIDNSQIVKHHANILLLGDFNVDLLKPHSSYYYTARQDSFLTAACEITYSNYTAVCYSYRSHIHKQPRRYHRGQNT